MDTVRFPLEVSAKIRYSHEPAKCRVVEEEGKLKCQFEEAQRAPTPGQAIVFYSDDLVVGGATIL
ncbi:hypothetical protein AN643_01750 [Candidatus Epulonipiscioides saccharophilum]|nr:hypothetical protein AN643_01750 [Epulopiscium sp. SCG-B10WGA-EpuloB]